ncbi:MAG: hypothetical protein J6X56_06095 [Ruminococcus sp.]|nr:hypothetical protein [Ruminococcus sp.]
MIRIRICGTDVRIHFSFFVFNALIFLFRSSSLILAFYTVCALHEAGHLAALALCGGRVRAVEISGAGIRIVTRKGGTFPTRSSVFVLLSGPAANIAVYSVMKFAGCGGIFPLLNFSAAVYNMLPYYSLDGGAVIACITEGRACERTAALAVKVMGIMMTAISAAAFLRCGITALPLLIASAALYTGDIRR